MTITSTRAMDDSGNDILLVDDLDESDVSESVDSISSSDDVLNAEVAPIPLKGQVSSVFSSMFESVGSIFNQIIRTFKSTKNSASSKAKSIRQSRDEKQTRRLAIAENKANQDGMVMVAAEIQSFEWEILGMDCPDCATKAKQAISRIDGAESCEVSVLEGKISIKIDLSLTTVSRISRILSSIGHPPDCPWETIQGVTPNMIE